MLIIPAIDIQDGCVVRFVQGRLNKKIYSRHPLNTARHWVKQGAGLVHVVDLDGAATGSLKNFDIVKEIVKNVDVPIQFGGGVRTQDAIKQLLDCGVYRVVLGTKAFEDLGFLKKAYRTFKDKIIVSIDAKDGCIQIKGWQASHKKIDAIGFAHTLKKIGFKQMIYTDVAKDGTLRGPNIKYTKNLLRLAGMKIIYSGGISSLSDISRFKLLEKQGLVGIIIGKALYEGRLTLSEALKKAA